LEPKFEEINLPARVEEQESASESNLLERKTFRVALISIFTALAVVIGYALVFVPNVELFTLILSRFYFRKKRWDRSWFNEFLHIYFL